MMSAETEPWLDLDDAPPLLALSREDPVLHDLPDDADPVNILKKKKKKKTKLEFQLYCLCFIVYTAFPSMYLGLISSFTPSCLVVFISISIDLHPFLARDPVCFCK
jgi:hypothetical protein